MTEIGWQARWLHSEEEIPGYFSRSSFFCPMFQWNCKSVPKVWRLLHKFLLKRIPHCVGKSLGELLASLGLCHVKTWLNNCWWVLCVEDYHYKLKAICLGCWMVINEWELGFCWCKGLLGKQVPLQGLAPGEKVFSLLLLYAGVLANATCRCFLFQIYDALFPQVSRRLFKGERSVLTGFSCWVWSVCPVLQTTTVNSLWSHGKGLVAAELAALAAGNCNCASSILGSWVMTGGQNLAILPFPSILYSPGLKEDDFSCRSLSAKLYCSQSDQWRSCVDFLWCQYEERIVKCG